MTETEVQVSDQYGRLMAAVEAFGLRGVEFYKEAGNHTYAGYTQAKLNVEREARILEVAAKVETWSVAVHQACGYMTSHHCAKGADRFGKEPCWYHKQLDATQADLDALLKQREEE